MRLGVVSRCDVQASLLVSAGQICVTMQMIAVNFIGFKNRLLRVTVEMLMIVFLRLLLQKAS
jgi:hypothetical protein